MEKRIDSEKVRKLYENGWTVRRIARHLGFTYAGVRIRLVRDGVKIREERALKFDIGLLRELYVDKQMTATQTMRKMGASQGTFYRMVRQAGIALRARSKLDVNEITRLYVEEGWSLQEIARRFDVHRETIRYHLVKKGVTIREPLGYKLSPAKAEELYTVQKLSLAKIAAATGASRSTVWRHLKQAGVPLRQISSDSELV